MKAFYFCIIIFLFSVNAYATKWPVIVANFSFSPATTNAVVGDTIEFKWASGFHTTTCGSGLGGTSLPAGAAEWNSSVDPFDTTFSYKVTVAGNYLYGCVPHFSVGMQGNLVVSDVLPVKFGQFSITDANGVGIIKWKTFSEENTKFFLIKKSIDAINFSEIGRLSAAGNSAASVAYQFEDKDLGKVNRYLYYEIAIVDADNKTTFSEIKTLSNKDAVNSSVIIAISPNPVPQMGTVQVQFNADKAGEMKVEVVSSAGQVVMKTSMAAFYGVNKSHLHVCGLNKGTYNVVFNLNGKTEVRKIVVL